MKLSVQVRQEVELKCLRGAEVSRRATLFSEKPIKNQYDHQHQEVTWNRVCLNLEKEDPLRICNCLLAPSGFGEFLSLFGPSFHVCELGWL